jgi:hypothetical protein
MQYVKQQLTEFVSSNLTDIYDDWNPNTVYTVEMDNNALTNASMVRYGAYYYRSVTNDNKGYNPVQYENIKWVKHSVSNKFAMLDMSANSKSIIQNGSITVVFKQNYIELLGFGNYEAEYIEVELLAEDMTTVVWSKNTTSQINVNVYDYWDYIYAPYFNESDHTETMVIPLLGTIGEEFTDENQQFILVIKNFNRPTLSAKINTVEKGRNLRINQIILPDGSADGPFSREMKYTKKQSGTYKIVFGKNLMAEGKLKGNISVTVE